MLDKFHRLKENISDPKHSAELEIEPIDFDEMTNVDDNSELEEIIQNLDKVKSSKYHLELEEVLQNDIENSNKNFDLVNNPGIEIDPNNYEHSDISELDIPNENSLDEEYSSFNEADLFHFLKKRKDTKCSLCNFVSNSFNLLKEHIRTNHVGKAIRNLRQRRLMLHNVDTDNNNELTTVRCSLCDFSTGDISEMMPHLSTFHSSEASSLQEKHKQSNIPGITCDPKHSVELIIEPIDFDEMINADDSSELEKTIQNLDKVKSSKHENNPEIEIEPNNYEHSDISELDTPDENNLDEEYSSFIEADLFHFLKKRKDTKCSLCNFVSNSFNLLKKHIHINHVGKVIRNLRQHRLMLHNVDTDNNNELTFVRCSLCDFSTGDISEMKPHISTFHSSEASSLQKKHNQSNIAGVTCDICGLRLKPNGACNYMKARLLDIPKFAGYLKMLDKFHRLKENISDPKHSAELEIEPIDFDEMTNADDNSGLEEIIQNLDKVKSSKDHLELEEDLQNDIENSNRNFDLENNPGNEIDPNNYEHSDISELYTLDEKNLDEESSSFNEADIFHFLEKRKDTKCSLCNFVSNSFNLLKEHIRTNHVGKAIRNLRQRRLMLHNVDTDNNNELTTVRCSLCDFSTGDISEMMLHLSTFHSSEASSLQEKHKQSNIPGITCDPKHSVELIIEPIDFDEMINADDNSELEKTIQNLDKVKSSKHENNPEIEIEPNNYEHSDISELDTPDENNLDEEYSSFIEADLFHFLKKRKDTKCSLCNFVSNSFNLLKKHIHINHVGKAIRNLRQRRLMLHNVDTDNNNELTTVRCSLCDFSTGDISEMKPHISTFHSGEASSLQEKHKQSNIPGVTCDICGLRFKSSGACNHMKARLLDFPKCYCPKCNSLFYQKHLVLDHQHTVHFVCRYCKKEFASRLEVKQHETNHSRERIYQCSWCDKSFVARSGLNFHTSSHTGLFNFKCNICDKKFYLKKSLNEHMDMHMDKARHICSICGKSFIYDSSFRMHKKWHDDPFPAKCRECPKVFRHPTVLARHRRIIHEGKTPDFPCSICNKNFSSNSSRKYHQMIHSGKFPYKCKVCNRGFTRKYHYAVHLARKHNDNSVLENKIYSDYKVTVLRNKTNLLEENHPQESEIDSENVAGDHDYEQNYEIFLK